MAEKGICADGEAIFAVMHNGRSELRWQLEATGFAEAEVELKKRNTNGWDFLCFEVKPLAKNTRQP